MRLAVAERLGPGRRPRFRDAVSRPFRAAGGARRGNGGGQGTIVVGAAERPEREQWAVAHEIGESVAYRVFERLGVAFDEALPTARELVANRLASCSAVAAALVRGRRPRARLGFARAEGALRHGQPRADRAADARDAAADRDHGLRLGPRSLAAKQRHGPAAGNAAGRNGRVAGSRIETGLPTWRTLDRGNRPGTVRCWPIHEPDWKREILRSEIAECLTRSANRCINAARLRRLTLHGRVRSAHAFDRRDADRR